MSTTPAVPVPRPWRRFLRFSVRRTIVLVLVIGGWLGWTVRNARIQRETVGAIECAGGWVRYDSGWTDNRTLEIRVPSEPHWRVDAIGVDYFAPVFAVTLAGGAPIERSHTSGVSRRSTPSRS
jgi:hypothetical protein